VRSFFTRATPPFRRVLLVESGSRQLYDDLIAGLFETYGDQLRVDLVTCFAGAPATLPADRSRIYRVTDFAGPVGRKRLYAELRANRYDILGMICSAEPIMTKWKWMLAARLPVKVFVLNENGDYFWLDWGHWKTIRHFLLFRAGLTGAGAVRTLARLALFPFTVLYLLMYATAAHLRRRWNLLVR
jgi:hypothetical protein